MAALPGAAFVVRRPLIYDASATRLSRLDDIAFQVGKAVARRRHRMREGRRGFVAAFPDLGCVQWLITGGADLRAARPGVGR